LIIMGLHCVVDGVSLHDAFAMVLELLGGSNTPGGSPRSDIELGRILEDEWNRCTFWLGASEAIVPATEVRLAGRPRSKLNQAAWTVDNQILQRRFIVCIFSS
jgi:hypothetical protein